MIAAGMLAPNSNVAELARHAFAPLDAVTDEWIEKDGSQDGRRRPYPAAAGLGDDCEHRRIEN